MLENRCHLYRKYHLLVSVIFSRPY